MEIDTIYNMDCLEGMKMIPDGSVDCIICDLPYGIMKGIVNAPGWGNSSCEWDTALDTDKLFEQYERVLRMNGVAILFSMEPYTSHLRTYQYRNSTFEFCYPMIWEKDSCGNALASKVAPQNYFEDINVFAKRHDTACAHPLRAYQQKIKAFCGISSCKGFNERLGHRHAEHFFYDSTQFALCTEETYNELIEQFDIAMMDGFMPYEELKKIDSRYQRVFNLPEGKLSIPNIWKFSKDTDGFHPTQKPVALIRRLIQTYSNEGDTILDNCMGSGTTAIASIREKRHFIGFELNAEYYEKAMKRIKLERQQLTLF